jgi:O-antigen/teichoic acid export membrane protein
MGIIQKDALRTTVISYLGLVLGYLNKAFLFLIFLSAEEVGLVNLIVTVGLLFAQLANLGTVYATWRFFPFFRNDSRKNYGFLLLNSLVVCFGIVLFTIIFFAFQSKIATYFSLKSPLFVAYYFWVIPLGIGTVFLMLFENYMRGLQKNILPVFLQDIVVRFVVTLLLIGFGLGYLDFEQFLILHLFAYFIPAISLCFYLVKMGELHFSLKSITVPKRFRKILLSFSSFSYLNTLAALFVISMDAMMIASILGLKQTGVYTTMVYITSAIQVPYRSMIRVSSPIIARFWKEKNMKDMQSLYEKSSSVGLLIGLLSFLAVWTTRTELFSFLRAEYSDGIYALLFLMIGRMVDMYCGLNGTIFATSRKYMFDLAFTIFLCAGIFVMNLYLIPIYGITGAAFSTGFIYVFYNFARSYYIYRVYGLHPFKWTQFRLIALFVVVLVLIEGASYIFIHGQHFTTLQNLIILLIKWFLILMLFLFPVVTLNLESESSRYFKIVMSRIRTRVRP